MGVLRLPINLLPGSDLTSSPFSSSNSSLCYSAPVVHVEQSIAMSLRRMRRCSDSQSIVRAAMAGMTCKVRSLHATFPHVLFLCSLYASLWLFILRYQAIVKSPSRIRTKDLGALHCQRCSQPAW